MNAINTGAPLYYLVNFDLEDILSHPEAERHVLKWLFARPGIESGNEKAVLYQMYTPRLMLGVWYGVSNGTSQPVSDFLEVCGFVRLSNHSIA